MCVTSLLGGSWADLWPFYGLCCERFSLYIEEESTLGTRGFSWAVSGFGQVLKSGSLKKSSPLVSSAFGRTRVGLWPTKRSSPSHAWKNLWYLGKEERGKRKEERGSWKKFKVSQNMVSFSEPSENQTLNLRSIKCFKIAWLFLIDIW